MDFEVLRAGQSPADSDSGAEVARKFNDNFSIVEEKLAESKSLGLSGVSAGKFLEVKSVDSSGRPTAWSAVDIVQDISMGIYGASPGQIIMISETNDAGVPIVLDAMDIPQVGETVELDDTLTSPNKAAQAKAVGDALEALRVSGGVSVTLKDDGDGNVVIKGAGSVGGTTGAGVSEAMAHSLWNLLNKVRFITADNDAEVAAFCDAWGIGMLPSYDNPPDPALSVSHDDDGVAIFTGAGSVNTEYDPDSKTLTIGGVV